MEVIWKLYGGFMVLFFASTFYNVLWNFYGNLMEALWLS